MYACHGLGGNQVKYYMYFISYITGIYHFDMPACKTFSHRVILTYISWCAGIQFFLKPVLGVSGHLE